MSLIQQLGESLLNTRKLVSEIHMAIRNYTGDSQSPVAQLRKDHEELPQLVVSTEKALNDMTLLATQTQQHLDSLQHELQTLGNQLTQTSQDRLQSLESTGHAVHDQLVDFTKKVQAALEDAQNRGNQLKTAAQASAESCKHEAGQQSTAHKGARASLAEGDSIVQKTYQPGHYDEFAAAAKNLANRLHTLAQETLPTQTGKLSHQITDTHRPAVQSTLSSAGKTMTEAHSAFEQHGLEAAQVLKTEIQGETSKAQNITAKELPDQIDAAAKKADQSAQQLSKESDTTKRTAAHTSTHLKDQQDRYFEAVLALHTELQRMLGGKK
ncbi:MAG: hypothetical protein KF760_28725 [Candidatus Eremiobacteraeota bacterium]|nr:hypothetical protein [Candidatus Eremiobacteraeota bacterium]MCW5865881.1 hypothetical protein [Candidatus Eremiobacteraeota bacterium]